MFVRPFARMEQLGYHSTDLYEILYMNIFRESVGKIQVSLKLDRKNVRFTWRPTYTYENTSQLF